MRRKRPTSYQVAERAGVSRSTVSLILNDVPGMKFAEVTRERVLQAAQDLGYVPDAAARTLASGETRTLGLVLFDAHHLRIDAFISQVLYSLAEVSREQGFRIIIETVENVERDEAYADLVRAKQIDGLIVLNPRSDDEQLPRLIDQGFPIVLIGKIRHEGAHAVYHASSAELAVSHLSGLGHRRIAHITYAPIHFLSANDRLSGYRRALAKAGIPLDEALVRVGDYTAGSGYDAMRSLLDAAPHPDAVFAGNDTIAVGAIAAIHEHGLRIPDDIAVVGYDDIPVAPFLTPPLTTVHVPALEQGRLAGEMLVDIIRGEDVPEQQIRLATHLVVRRSCGAPTPEQPAA